MAKPERAQSSSPLYERDYHAWLEEQVRALNERGFDRLDIVNLAEELGDLGRSERRQLESRLEVLLAHLLKWAYDPRKRSKSWKNTIRDQRQRIEMLLEDSPSLSRYMDEALNRACRLARGIAGDEMDLDEKEWNALFPLKCPWTSGEILRNDFHPEAPARIAPKRR